jgi:uncharacterized protein
VTEYLQVSVAYVGLANQALRPLEVRTGTSVREAIEQCGLLDQFTEIDLDTNKVGIFGRLAKLEQVVEEGDRIEIYRPLIADPKAARKQRPA